MQDTSWSDLVILWVPAYVHAHTSRSISAANYILEFLKPCKIGIHEGSGSGSNNKKIALIEICRDKFFFLKESAYMKTQVITQTIIITLLEVYTAWIQRERQYLQKYQGLSICTIEVNLKQIERWPNKKVTATNQQAWKRGNPTQKETEKQDQKHLRTSWMTAMVIDMCMDLQTANMYRIDHPQSTTDFISETHIVSIQEARSVSWSHKVQMKKNQKSLLAPFLSWKTNNKM